MKNVYVWQELICCEPDFIRIHLRTIQIFVNVSLCLFSQKRREETTVRQKNNTAEFGWLLLLLVLLPLPPPPLPIFHHIFFSRGWHCECVGVRVFSAISHNSRSHRCWFGRFTCRNTLICWIVRFDWVAALHIIEAIIAWESVTWRIIIQTVKIQVAVTIVSMASVSPTAII